MEREREGGEGPIVAAGGGERACAAALLGDGTGSRPLPPPPGRGRGGRERGVRGPGRSRRVPGALPTRCGPRPPTIPRHSPSSPSLPLPSYLGDRPPPAPHPHHPEIGGQGGRRVGAGDPGPGGGARAAQGGRQGGDVVGRGAVGGKADDPGAGDGVPGAVGGGRGGRRRGWGGLCRGMESDG